MNGTRCTWVAALCLLGMLTTPAAAAGGDTIDPPAKCNGLGTYCIEGAATATPTLDQTECDGGRPFPDFKCFRLVIRSTVFVEFGGSTRLDVSAASAARPLADTCFVTAFEYECMAQDIEHAWVQEDMPDCVAGGKGEAHSTVYGDIETPGTLEANCDDPFTPDS